MGNKHGKRHSTVCRDAFVSRGGAITESIMRRRNHDSKQERDTKVKEDEEKC